MVKQSDRWTVEQFARCPLGAQIVFLTLNATAIIFDEKPGGSILIAILIK